MKHRSPKKKKSTLLLNILFAFVAVGILMFLFNAPEKSTTRLPHDDNHQRFYDMKKKEAEKYCLDCHAENEVKPLPEDHPTKLRCLMCHTRD